MLLPLEALEENLCIPSSSSWLLLQFWFMATLHTSLSSPAHWLLCGFFFHNFIHIYNVSWSDTTLIFSPFSQNLPTWLLSPHALFCIFFDNPLRPFNASCIYMGSLLAATPLKKNENSFPNNHQLLIASQLAVKPHKLLVHQHWNAGWS